MEKIIRSKEKPLLLMCILFIVFQFGGVLLYLIDGTFDLSWTMESILMAAICCTMYYSYKTHTKNIMKPIIGAALIIILVYEMDYAGYFIQYQEYYATCYPNAAAFTVAIIGQTGLFISIAIINVMHYVINSTHHSSPDKVKFNNIMFGIYALFLIGKAITCVFLGSEAIITIANVMTALSDMFMIAMVIVIERSLDEFRIQREERINSIN